MHDPGYVLPRIPLPRTSVNKAATCSRGCDAGVACLRPGNKVEAKKPVPHVGTFWDEWSQWGNRLPQA
jgi:hypothetical protein